jgi:hypothetical protein
MMARRRYEPRSSQNTLLVMLRDKAGSVGHVAIGSAIVDADWDATLSMLAAKSGADGLLGFFCSTPSQAKRAMDELNAIGDVPFHLRDFAPKWFWPRAGITAVAWLLGNRAKARLALTDAVCVELERVRRVLEAARRTGRRFHLVELEEGEDRSFAGPRVMEEPENNQLLRAAPGESKPRR